MRKSQATEAKKNFTEFLKGKDDYPVIASPLQHHPNPKELLDNIIIFVDQTIEDGNEGMAIREVVRLKQQSGKPDEQIKKEVIVIPRKQLVLPALKKALKDYPVTFFNTTNDALSAGIRGATIHNPPTSQRNAQGTGRSTVFSQSVNELEFLKDSKLHHITLARSGWWISASSELEYRKKFKRQLVKMVKSDYSVKDDIWASFFHADHNGPTEIVSNDTKMDYDYRTHDEIVNTLDPMLNDIFYKCKTPTRYKMHRSKNKISSNTVKKSIRTSEGHWALTNLSFRVVEMSNGRLVIKKSYDRIRNTECNPSNEPHFFKWKLVAPYNGTIVPGQGKGLRFAWALVPPGICIPGNTYCYLVFDSKAEARRHQAHFETPLVNAITDHTRLGRSISDNQMQFIPHLDHLSTTMEGMTEDEKVRIDNLKTEYGLRVHGLLTEQQ